MAPSMVVAWKSALTPSAATFSSVSRNSISSPHYLALPMKKLVLCLFCLAFPASLLYAQKIIEKTLPYSANQQIELELKIAENIRITTWDKNEFYIKASVEINGG